MKLKDQIHQTTLITKDGTLETSHNDKRTTIEDTFHDNLQSLEAKIRRAKETGSNWVETSKEMIDYLMPQGWKDYAWYRDIKLCEFGKSDALQAEIDTPLYQKQFNGTEGVVET